MYRSSLDARHKGGAIVAVAAIHLLLLLVLLNLSTRFDSTVPQAVLRVFDVAPPPLPPEPVQQQAASKPRPRQGGAASSNLKSEASPAVAPAVPVAAMLAIPSSTPAQGSATQGQSQVAGAGTGGGGQGSGTGNGSGAGTGSGDGGAVTRPQLATPVLSGRDFPRDVLKAWPRGEPVRLILRIDPQGYISECTIDHGTGVAAIDSAMCNIAHQRLRFRPALDRAGQPVAGWFGYGQTPPR